MRDASNIRGVALMAAFVLVACSGVPAATTGSTRATATATAAPATSTPRIELHILGAASLKEALEQAQVAFEAAYPGTRLTISTDSSAALETQIEQGAPADVFLSADTANPQKLVDGGLAAGNAIEFAMNALTIIVPADNPAGIAVPADLAKPGVKLIAAGDEVPISRYANQLIDRLAALAPDADAFKAAIATNTVTKVENVRAVVAQVELGQGDAGIVYVTDAATSTEVATVALPADVNVRAAYAGVVVGASANAVAAQAFLAWLAGPDGQAILEPLGFLPPPS